MSLNYMTAEELAAFNEANNTKLKGDHYLAINPKTGEEGAWMFTSQTGWTDASKLGGPRTHYEDGTPVPDFSYRRDWNPNWSIRTNDLYRIAGGQHGGSSRTTLRPGEEYAALNSPYWRTPAGRQFINEMAISNKPIHEIYKEMVRLNNFSEEREEAKQEWARLRSGTANDSSADTSGGLLSNYDHQRAKSQWDIDADVPQATIDKITKTVDENMKRHEIIGKEGDNRYMFGDADLPPNIPAPPDDGSEYMWVGSMGWTKTGGFSERDRQISIETAVRNTHGFDDKEVNAMRVANTGNHGWFSGGDQGQYMDINPHDMEAIQRMFGEEGYNPYYGRGWNNSEWRARSTELKGGDDSFLNPWKNRLPGNIMDYLYDATKADYKTRGHTDDAFNTWMANKGVTQKDLFRTRMTERDFDAMGLGDILGTGFDSSYNERHYTDRERAFANRGTAQGDTRGRTPRTPRASSLFDSYMEERNL